MGGHTFNVVVVVNQILKCCQDDLVLAENVRTHLLLILFFLVFFDILVSFISAILTHD